MLVQAKVGSRAPARREMHSDLRKSMTDESLNHSLFAAYNTIKQHHVRRTQGGEGGSGGAEGERG